MSVINKMLRDLDARRSAASPQQPRATPELLRGTASVPGLGRTRRFPWLAAAAVAAALLLALAGWIVWQSRSGGHEGPAPAAPLALPAVPPPEPAASEPQPVAAALPPAQQIMEAAAAAAAQRAQPGNGGRASAGAEAPRQAAPAPTADGGKRKRPAVDEAAAPAPLRQRPAATTGAAPVASQLAAAQPAASSAAVAAAPAPSQPAQRAAAVQEALAQAQGLWAQGSRESAVELLREALATAERAGAADPEIQLLARELARMELAQGRAGQALELLTRLEPRLANQADLWALRGNAAQRLGRHGEAVLAYERALQLRADEPRWQLAAAVSLAALGQLDAAARYVAQARAAGPVNPEVLNYLRQAGVAVP